MTLPIASEARLAHLTSVIDPALMRFRFVRQGEANEPAIAVERCAIEKIYYRPGHSCTVLYHLHYADRRGNSNDQWVIGKLFPNSKAAKRFDEARAELVGADDDAENELPPVFFWPDLDMVLWRFPHDPKLPALQQLASPEFVRHEVHRRLHDFFLRNSWNPGKVTMERVKYMPGKRCVLRYRGSMERGSEPSWQLTFYSKSYYDNKSQYHFELLRHLHNVMIPRPHAFRIPRPICHLPEVHTFWQEEWRGQALLDVIDRLEWRVIFPRMAMLLADLHQTPLRNLRRGPDLGDALNVALEDGRELMALMPSMQSAIATMLEALARYKPTLETQAIPETPIHGAIRLEQMLYREGELALVDFDAIATGDPIFDVAELIASLQYLELTHEMPSSKLMEASQAFCTQYTESAPWPLIQQRLAWYALAFLISKMFLSVKNLDLRAMQALGTAGIRLCNGWLETLAG